jgi:cobalamin biosynthesis protein CobT
MAGNNLETKWGKIARTFSRNHDIQIQLSGTRCDTDLTGTINLPANSDDYKDADAQVLEGLLDHEWKHVEVQRKAVEQGITTPKALMDRGDNKTNQLFNVYEDYRIERELAGEYVGCADNLKSANEHVVKLARTHARNLEYNPFRAVGLGIFGSLMGVDISWIPAEAQKITEMLKPVWSKAEGMKTHIDAYKLAKETLEAMGDLKDEMEQPEPQQQEGGQSGESQPADEQGGTGDGDIEDNSEVKDFLDRLNEQPDNAVQDDLMDNVKESMEDKSKMAMRRDKRHIAHPEIAKLDRTCNAESHSANDYNRQLKAVKKTVGALRSKLITVIRARSQKGFITERESGNIDVASLYRLRTGDKRVFFEPHKKLDLNTAVSVLVDHSISMSGNKQSVAQQSAIALAETLNHLGVSVEVLGFRTGRGGTHGIKQPCYNRYLSVKMVVYKGFKESFHKVKTRMARMPVDGTTPLNTGLWNAAMRLAVQPEQRKILIVLSDGKPQLSGSDVTIMRGDLINKVRRVEAAGIECVGVGIEDRNVQDFFRDHTVIKNASQLPRELFKILKRKLT